MQARFSILPVPEIVDIIGVAGRCQDASAFLIELWHLALAIVWQPTVLAIRKYR